MRVAAVADLHGNLAAFEAVLADIARQGIAPAQIVIAGDIAMAGPQPAEVLTRVRLLQGAGAVVVGGNVDRWGQDFIPAAYTPAPGSQAFLVGAYRLAQRALEPDDWRWLAGLPAGQRVPVNSTLPGALVVHGSPRSETEGLFPGAPDEELLAALADLPLDLGALICAHTHQPMVRHLAGRLVVNVGSVGRPADGDPRAAYALISYRLGRWEALVRRVSYDVEATVEAARRAGLPGVEWYASSLRTGTLEGQVEGA